MNSMKGKHLIGSNVSEAEGNLFANRSALVVHWLLFRGVNRSEFTLREVAREAGVSLGLTQKVFKTLAFEGILTTEGVRTAKKFSLKKGGSLLKKWADSYSMTSKCRYWSYRSKFQSAEEVLNLIRDKKLSNDVALTLHSAAKAYGLQNTNLHTFELYLLNPEAKEKLEKYLCLEPQEKGYEILLIQPYYKALLKEHATLWKGLKVAPIDLTYVDLLHFPLRGEEQAQFLLERDPGLNRLVKR